MASYLDAFIPCEPEYQHREVLYCSTIGLIASVLGLLHNIVFATVAYRLKWFEFYQFFLICNQIISDITTYIFYIIYSCFSVTLLVLDCENGQLMYDFTVDFSYLTNFPIRVAIIASQKAAIVIAIDRLYLLLRPYRWIRLSVWYRYGLIGVAWTWAIGQEMVAALIFVSSPQVWHSGLFYYQVSSSAITSLILIILYIITAFVSPSFCKRATRGTSSIRIFCADMETTQRRVIRRVNTLAFLTVSSHILLGLTHFTMNSPNAWTAAPIIAAVAIWYGIWPIYIFCWRDKVFRNELKKCCVKCFEVCWYC